MPEGFEWSILDLEDDKQMQELFNLLRENYVEDKDHTFRFEYPVDFIRWGLLVPGYNKEWHLGVRSTKTKKLLAFVSGTPIKG